MFGKLFKNINPKNFATGLRTLGIGLALEYAAQGATDWVFDRIFGTEEEQANKAKERYEEKSQDEREKLIKRLKEDLKREEEWQAGFGGVFDKVIALGGETSSDIKTRLIRSRLEILENIETTTPQTKENEEFKESIEGKSRGGLVELDPPRKIIPQDTRPGKDIGGIGEIQKTFPLEKPRSLPTLCLLYTSPSPRDATLSRMPSSA